MSARVVVAGGGVAGMEAALALSDLAGDVATVTMVAPEPDFILKPLTVEEPFTNAPAERHELRPALAELGAELMAGAVTAVDPANAEVQLGEGARIGYDRLIVCVGGRTRPPYEGVETFTSTRGDLPVDELIRRANSSPGGALALLVPPATSWSLPLYELALLVRRRSEQIGCAGLRVRLITPEDAPLAIFGERASEAVGALLEGRRIDIETSRYVSQAEDGALRVAPDGDVLEPGSCLALPIVEGARLEGLPADEHGFLPIDLHARVRGVPGVYAAGDGTDFPVKQGGIAAQQADAAAEHIAASLGADVDPRPFEPVLRGQLLTGEESLHMTHGLTGGTGEGAASLDYLWWPPQKVAGRYLSAWLGHTAPTDLSPPARPLDVEASWPHEWHGRPGAAGL